MKMKEEQTYLNGYKMGGNVQNAMKILKIKNKRREIEKYWSKTQKYDRKCFFKTIFIIQSLKGFDFEIDDRCNI